MMPDQVARRKVVIDAIAEEAGWAQTQTLNGEAAFKELGLDSLDLVAIYMEIEEGLSIEIDDEALSSESTVDDLFAAVEKAACKA